MGIKPLSEGLLDEKIDEVVKKLYECDGIIRLSNDESRERSLWRGKSGVIYSDITSDGTTGCDWISRLENGGHRVGGYVTKHALSSYYFKPTNGVTRGVAILRGELFRVEDRSTQNICDLALRCGLGMLHHESACLMREKFSNMALSDMRLNWIISMNEPMDTTIGNPRLFGLSRSWGDSWLNSYVAVSNDKWDEMVGFAFEVL